MQKVVFFYPSQITGGAEFLLKTAADLLKDTHDVTIVDRPKGWLSENVSGVRKKILDGKGRVKLDDDVVLITTANLIRYLDAYFIGQFKLIAWIVHPFILVPVFPKIGPIQFQGILKKIFKRTLLRSEYRKIGDLSIYLQEKNSLYMIDEACNEIFFSYFQRKIPCYLPAIIPDRKFQDEEKIAWTRDDNCVKCLWLGRLDNSFKNPILHHVLCELSTFAQKSSVTYEFHIIGDGPGFTAVVDLAKRIQNVNVYFYKEKTGNDLSKIIKQCDIGFAMGMSALEIAAYAIPVVLLDASYAKVPASYRYRWLSDVTGYCLGRSIDHASDKTLGNTKSLGDIFHELEKSELIIGEQCRAHVRAKHSGNALRDKLINAIKNSTSNFQEIESLRLLGKPYWQLVKEIFI